MTTATQTRVTSSAKPRLGDHYRAADFDALFVAHGIGEQRHGHSQRTFWLALGLFKNTKYLDAYSRELTVADVAKASDAFAFGALKYREVGGWRGQPLDHHLQAAGRHFGAWLEDPESLDAESGLTHEAHFLARAIMVVALRRLTGE